MLAGIIAIVAGLIVGATLGRYLVLQVAGTKPLPLPIRIGGVIGVIASVLVILMATADLKEAAARQKWPTVIATVDSGRVVGTKRTWTWDEVNRKIHEKQIPVDSTLKRDRNYRPEVTYSYTVHDTPYEATSHCHLPGFGGKLNRLDAAVKTLMEYPIGSDITVSFNPDNPADSYLKAGPTWDPFVRISFGVVILTLAIGILAAALAKPRA